MTPRLLRPLLDETTRRATAASLRGVQAEPGAGDAAELPDPPPPGGPPLIARPQLVPRPDGPGRDLGEEVGAAPLLLADGQQGDEERGQPGDHHLQQDAAEQRADARALGERGAMPIIAIPAPALSRCAGRRG